MNMRSSADANESQRWKQDITKYTEALSHTPDDVNAYLHRGFAYRMLGQYEQAISDYSQAIQFDPQNSKAYAYRAIVYEKLNQSDRQGKYRMPDWSYLLCRRRAAHQSRVSWPELRQLP